MNETLFEKLQVVRLQTSFFFEHDATYMGDKETLFTQLSYSTFTDLRNLMRNFSTFSLACLFYFTFGPKSFVRTSVNGIIK